MKKYTLIKLLMSLWLVNGLQVLSCYSQANTHKDTLKVNELRDYYRVSSTGITNLLVRDFATSPLFYDGFGTEQRITWLSRSTTREQVFEFGSGINGMFARIPKSDFIQPSTNAILAQVHLRYSRLFQLKSLSIQNYNFKWGGAFHTTQNIRINPGLFNNSMGLENSTTIMVSGQLIKDISRNQPRKLNLWVYKPTLKPVKRDLRFQFNAGVLNFNYRPGYAYSYDEELIGLETQPLAWVLSGYNWSLNGWRFNTDLEYITYLPNGNAKSWSYAWDATNMPGRHENFQMASHQIRFRYYFHTKRK